MVRRITEVRSVDLVADPATTRGLFERRERKRAARLDRLRREVKLREARDHCWEMCSAA